MEKLSRETKATNSEYLSTEIESKDVWTFTHLPCSNGGGEQRPTPYTYTLSCLRGAAKGDGDVASPGEKERASVFPLRKW